MPVHLDSISRRAFLGQAAVFSAAACTGSAAVFATEPSRKSWALLADTHIAADPALVSRQGINMADHLRRVVAEIASEADTLCGVIVDGDCAYDDGQPGDYSTLAGLIRPLIDAGLPVHFTMGNHDDRAAFREALIDEGSPSPVADKHCGILETPELDWILVDTLRFVNKVEGEIGAAQLEWLAQRLGENGEKPAVVVGHHYPQVERTDVIPSDEPIRISGLIDSEAFLSALNEAPAAKAYVFGHSHRWSHQRDESGFHRVNLPPTAYVFDPSCPSGWVRATPDATGMTLVLSALDKEHPSHGETLRLDWR